MRDQKNYLWQSDTSKSKSKTGSKKVNKNDPLKYLGLDKFLKNTSTKTNKKNRKK